MAADRDRQHGVDRLRGFALLGVLLVNTPFLFTSIDGLSDASMPHWWDRRAGMVTMTIFQAKGYVVFSFLFGYSLTIPLASVSARGLDGARLSRQRLGALLVLGALHATTLFFGDILAVYAVLGTLLLWRRTKSDGTALRVAAGLFALQVVLLVAVAFVPDLDVTATDWIDRDWIDRSWREDGFVTACRTRLTV